MTSAYATTSELDDFLPSEVVVDDAERKLMRAAELLDSVVRAPFVLDPDTDLPTDPAVAAALRDASCAQVEFWCEVGEEHDISGLAGKRISIGHLSIESLPAEVGPRARRILQTAGLLSSGQSLSTAASFFAGCSC